MFFWAHACHWCDSSLEGHENCYRRRRRRCRRLRRSYGRSCKQGAPLPRPVVCRRRRPFGTLSLELQLDARGEAAVPYAIHSTRLEYYGVSNGCHCSASAVARNPGMQLKVVHDCSRLGRCHNENTCACPRYPRATVRLHSYNDCTVHGTQDLVPNWRPCL